MNLAILSDIHANLPALDAVLGSAAAQGAEGYILLGDVVDYGAQPNEVVQRLRSLPILCAIAGNHEGCLFTPEVRKSRTPHGIAANAYTDAALTRESRSWLSRFAGRARMTASIGGHRILLAHGTPEDPYWGAFAPGDDPAPLRAAMDAEGADLLLLGHSHLQFELLEGAGRRICNPGSVGQPRNGCPDAQYALWEDGRFQALRVPYDIATAADRIRGAGLPERLSERLFTGR